jgi:pseudomonalisin
VDFLADPPPLVNELEEGEAMLNRGWKSALFWALIVFVDTWAAAAATNAPRIIGDRDRIVQSGSVHPLAQPQYEVVRTKADLPMERMIFSLSLRPGARERLEQLLAAQHDPHSPIYHQWLTPEQFGARFGLRDEDLETVRTWLTDQGFTIDEVAKGRRWINFSGTASQVERAFATEIRDYRVDGKLRHANATDISIPRGLADLVNGVVTLNSFPRQSHHTSSRKVSTDELNEKSSLWGGHFLGPADFATIYNLNPLYSAGFTGLGQTVAIVGRTDIRLADVQFFRSYFGLPVNDPIIVHNGTAPGIISWDEEAEADLDVEWAGAVAPNATIKFVVSKSTAASNGVDLSAQYIVNNNLAAAMSTSFGSCETAMGSAAVSFFDSVWTQAATQGITSFVSSGDSGAAGCNEGSDRSGSGLGVNGLCSTWSNVCVGGTLFADSTRGTTYWSTTNDALSYIPEIAWNESSSLGLWSTGGGSSSVWVKPPWQVAPGVPTAFWRHIPDVSLTAASHDGYLFVQGHTTGTTGLNVVGGTSASSPAFAGLMAIIVQKTGIRQGNANTVFYPMAANQLNHTGPVVFHDITSGNNTVPGVTGFSCTPGYDRATGLGSVDATALANNWAGVQIPLQLPPSVNTSATPSAISLNGKTYVFYKGSGDDPGIYVTSALGSIDPGRWTNAARLPLAINTSAAPSAVVQGSTIYVAYKGSGADPAIYVARSSDFAATWFATKFPGTVNTSTGPNAYLFGGALYVVYKGSGDDARMYVAPLPPNTDWNFLGANPNP